jgi:hypothetical protein
LARKAVRHPPHRLRKTSEKCPELTATSRSDGIGFTFRSSLVFSIAPSILAPIFFVVTLFIIDVPMQPAPTPVSLVAFPLFLGLIFWPFLWMYRYVRNALIEHPSSENSLRLATIMSVAAMSLPCSMLSLMASAGGGQGAGILAFLFLILLPLLGILGWLTGRGIAWILGP